MYKIKREINGKLFHITLFSLHKCYVSTNVNFLITACQDILEFRSMNIVLKLKPFVSKLTTKKKKLIKNTEDYCPNIDPNLGEI